MLAYHYNKSYRYTGSYTVLVLLWNELFVWKSTILLYLWRLSRPRHGIIQLVQNIADHGPNPSP